jgi:hypothetical protein
MEKTANPLWAMTTPPKAILSAGTLLRMPGIDEKVHENREEHKAEIPLGQNSAVQNGTTENREFATDRNKRVCHGGASRDRTDDLIVANDALSQLSYSPTLSG